MRTYERVPRMRAACARLHFALASMNLPLQEAVYAFTVYVYGLHSSTNPDFPGIGHSHLMTLERYGRELFSEVLSPGVGILIANFPGKYK